MEMITPEVAVVRCTDMLSAERERIAAAIVADLERRMAGYSTAHFAMARHVLGQVAADIPALVEGTP